MVYCFCFENDQVKPIERSEIHSFQLALKTLMIYYNITIIQ